MDDTEHDLTEFGAPAEIIEKLKEENKAETVFEVFEENWEAVTFFMRLQTQWVYAGMGSRIGLNYQSIQFLFEVYGVEDRKSVLDDLRVIEGAVLSMDFRESKEGG